MCQFALLECGGDVSVCTAGMRGRCVSVHCWNAREMCQCALLECEGEVSVCTGGMGGRGVGVHKWNGPVVRRGVKEERSGCVAYSDDERRGGSVGERRRKGGVNG